MPLDSNGIWRFEEADSGATMSDTLNLAQDATSARVADLQADIDSREPLHGDSGWVDVLTGGAHTPHPSYPPQVRQIGNRVYMRGGWTNTGIPAAAATIVAVVPVGFYPSSSGGGGGSAFTTFWAPATSQIGSMRVFSTGDIEVRTSQNAPSSLMAPDGFSWFTD